MTWRPSAANVDATANERLASRFGVQGFPTIKLFPATAEPNKRDSDAEAYQGPRQAGGIVSYALQKLEEAGIDPQVDQLVSKASWTKAGCGKKICAVLFVPHILEGGKAARQAHLDSMVAAAKQVRSGGFAYLWAEAGAQAKWESAMDLRFGFPAVVAVSEAKGIFIVHKGRMGADGVAGFLSAVAAGSRRMKATKFDGGLPKVVTTDPWDGEDGEVLEEEFDLADLMGDDEDEL